MFVEARKRGFSDSLIFADKLFGDDQLFGNFKQAIKAQLERQV